MGELFIKLTLEEKEIKSHAGPVDSGRDYHTPPSSDAKTDAEILASLDTAAEQFGLTKSAETKRRSENKVSGDRLNPSYYGGSYSFYEVTQILTYSTGAIAGFAAFINQVLSAAVHWRTLKEDRSVKIDVAGRSVYVKEGEAAADVLARIQAAIKENPALSGEE